MLGRNNLNGDDIMRVLFTAVGGSDPIKRMLDGPMLHCCRIYKPDIVYMYFTKKMLEYERADGRYTWVLEQLGKKIGHEFKIVRIEREDLVEVQLYDSYFDDFNEIIDGIYREYPEAEVYLNASSGTPAIKSTLVILAAMSEKKMTVLQVSSGATKPLHDRDNDDTYDKFVQWECDLDNEEPADRTSVVESTNFMARVKKQNIRRLAEANDYEAAIGLAEDIRGHLNEDVIKLLKAASARMRLDYAGVLKELKGTSFNIIPVKDDKKRDIAEYLLWLGIILKRGDYLSFIRGITPAAMVLMEETLKNRTPIGDIKKYCRESKKDKWRLAADIMDGSDIGKEMIKVLNERFNMFDDREYSTAQMEPLISEFCTDERIVSYVKTIRNAEGKVRNPAAHTIIAVDDDFIKRRIGISSYELYDTMKKLAVRAGIVRSDIWDSYDRMNEMILEQIGE